MFVKSNDGNDRELVSVLMAVYNTKAEYLNEAIESILSQTYKYIELIIIDDFSDNKDTIRVLSNVCDKRVRIYHNDKNIGLTKSLIKGMKLCNGRYIVRLDADDVSKKTRISNQYRYMKKKNYALVGCNCKMIPNFFNHAVCSSESVGYKVAMIFGNQGFCHSSFFIDKKCLAEHEINYDEKYKTAQDYALLCDCISCGLKIGFCAKTLIGLRRHDNQISVKNRSQQSSDADNIRTQYIIRNYKLSESEANEFVKAISETTYITAHDSLLAQKALQNILKNNHDAVVDKEIYKYWFRQSLNRMSKSGKTDFILSKMFFQSLRLDRLFYTICRNIIERIHYIYQPFVKI